MPLVRFYTNVKDEEINKSEFVNELYASIEKITGKPKTYLMVHVNFNQDLSFGGTDEKCAYFEYMQLGELSKSKIEEIAKEYTNITLKQLNVPKERVYIAFNDTTPRDHWSMGEKTFG